MIADQAPTVLDPYFIWSRARTAISSSVYPSRIAYTIAVSGKDGSNYTVQHYRGMTSTFDGSIRLSPVTAEEIASPPPPVRGVNVSFRAFVCWPMCVGVKVPVGHPAPATDLLGLPFLSPTYDFGMGLHRSPMKPGTSSNGNMRIIATVRSQSSDYTVALAGTDEIDGVSAYHLHLAPLRNPEVNRIRDVWIGADDYLPRKAMVSGNFTVAPLVDVPWLVRFSVIGDAVYVTSEEAMATLYMPHHRVVEGASIEFTGIHELRTLFSEPLISPDLPEDALREPRLTLREDQLRGVSCDNKDVKSLPLLVDWIDPGELAEYWNSIWGAV